MNGAQLIGTLQRIDTLARNTAMQCPSITDPTAAAPAAASSVAHGALRSVRVRPWLTGATALAATLCAAIAAAWAPHGCAVSDCLPLVLALAR
jgi:hypothetical protein